MKYLSKYVRFLETETITKEVSTEKSKKPIDPIPVSDSNSVVERLSRIYSELDDNQKSEIDKYFK